MKEHETIITSIEELNRRIMVANDNNIKYEVKIGGKFANDFYVIFVEYFDEDEEA